MLHTRWIQPGNSCGLFGTTCEFVITIFPSHGNGLASWVIAFTSWELGRIPSARVPLQVVRTVCTTSTEHTIKVCAFIFYWVSLSPGDLGDLPSVFKLGTHRTAAFTLQVESSMATFHPVLSVPLGGSHGHCFPHSPVLHFPITPHTQSIWSLGLPHILIPEHCLLEHCNATCLPGLWVDSKIPALPHVDRGQSPGCAISSAQGNDSDPRTSAVKLTWTLLLMSDQEHDLCSSIVHVHHQETELPSGTVLIPG